MNYDRYVDWPSLLCLCLLEGDVCGCLELRNRTAGARFRASVLHLDQRRPHGSGYALAGALRSRSVAVGSGSPQRGSVSFGSGVFESRDRRAVPRRPRHGRAVGQTPLGVAAGSFGAAVPAILGSLYLLWELVVGYAESSALERFRCRLTWLCLAAFSRWTR